MTRRPSPARRDAGGAWGAVLTSLLLLASCGGSAPRAEQDPKRRAQALIDAGNQAYQTGNDGLAARRFAAASAVRDDDPAAYYGIGMALVKLGRDEEARRAYAKARELAQAANAGTAAGSP